MLQPIFCHRLIRSALCVAVVCLTSAMSRGAEQTPVNEESSVDYWKDIAPVLQKNCLACHRSGEAEGGLSLESPQELTGGGDSGDTIVAGKPEESALYARVSGLEEPLMPPEDNSVGAKPLTPKELELLKRWIEQGAPIGERTDAEIINWEPIPETIRGTLALGITPDNRTAVVSHANRIELLNLATGDVAHRLADPRLDQENVADVDMIQAVAVSPRGDTIATGGFRTVRIWSKQPLKAKTPAAFSAAIGLVAVNADRSRAAIVNAIGDVEIRALPDGKTTTTLPYQNSRVTNLAFSDEQTLVAAYENGDVLLVDAASGKTIRRVALAKTPVSVVADAQGTHVAAAGVDQSVSVFHEGAPKELSSTKAIQDATTLALATTPNLQLAVGTAGGKIAVVDWNADSVRLTLDAGFSVAAMAINADASRIVAGGSDGQAKVWNLHDGAPVSTLSGDPTVDLLLAQATQSAAREKSWVDQLNGQTEGLKKSLESEDAALKKVVEAHDKAKQELADQEKRHQETTAAIAATEKAIVDAEKTVTDSNTLVTASEKDLTATKTRMDQLIAALPEMEKQAQVATQEVKAAEAKVAEAMKLLADAQTAAAKVTEQVNQNKAATAAEKKKVDELNQNIADAKKASADATQLVSTKKGELEKQKKSLEEIEKAKQGKQADLAERQQALVTSQKTRDRAAAEIPKHQDRIRRRANRLASVQLQVDSLTASAANSAAIAACVFTPQSDRVVVVYRDASVRSFQVDSGKAIDRFDLERVDFASRRSQACFIDATTLLVSQSQGAPSVVSLNHTWELSQTIGGLTGGPIADRVTALDFRADGAALAVGSGIASRTGQVLIVAVADGSVLRQFDDLHSDTVLSVKFAPDQTAVATGSSDKTIRIIDLQTGTVTGALDGHTHHVLSLAWKHDGRQIASGGADKAVKIWDTQTGQQRRTIGGFGDEVTSIQFLKDTSHIVTACADGTMRIHNADDGKFIRSAASPGDFLFSLDVTEDGEKIIAGGHLGTINVWNTSDAKVINTWK